ncbi:MlaD family protein [Verrucomicrobia bacterium]|jgi:phospholipid/cholesterol/gamma-HCH transport system substrate-binding protein|nr:MCE family protein [Verrucomicrobiota bacterium]MDA7644881.1 MlaD family protein [bacterium]MDA7680670.1 MlaD family protein [bacterium]MDA7866839.1 MlaD family protein [Verrucomicrobiota bacterium]MDB4798974.1 MlaD family protein [Verrucomicrobiota bacterium]
MKSTLETRLGIFFALALIGLFILMEVAGGFSVLNETVPVGARFNNIRDLKEGDPVKMAGVEIGKVESIGFAENQVKINLEIDAKNAPAVKTDSIASVQFMGLMGQNYVAIEFGQAGVPIQPGAELATREQPDIGALIAQIDGVAKGIEQVTDTFGGNKIGDMLGPLADFLKQNKDRVSTIIENVQVSTAQIAQGEGTIGRLIKEDTLYTTAVDTVNKLNNTSATLDVAIADAQAAIQDLRSGKGTLGKLATDEALYQETKVAMANLREILEKINRGDGSVGNLVNDSSLIDNAKATLQKVEKATESLEDQGPLSVIGLAVGRLF